ncbi:hypothetical protein CAAN1_05S03840 [[Candida] anglica]|uniref:Uncharacterized protein n=1 Tax=[Candida] anglica TaxID=148631 RepID=A0ABP0EFH4_9ASCO
MSSTYSSSIHTTGSMQEDEDPPSYRWAIQSGAFLMNMGAVMGVASEENVCGVVPYICPSGWTINAGPKSRRANLNYHKSKTYLSNKFGQFKKIIRGVNMKKSSRKHKNSTKIKEIDSNQNQNAMWPRNVPRDQSRRTRDNLKSIRDRTSQSVTNHSHKSKEYMKEKVGQLSNSTSSCSQYIKKYTSRLKESCELFFKEYEKVFNTFIIFTVIVLGGVNIYMFAGTFPFMLYMYILSM